MLRGDRQDGHSGDAQARLSRTTIATGSICAGGTLGILIPPSITFILYGIATETSIGRLFLAGVLPGLMLTGLFMLWTLFIIWKRGFRSHAADFRYTWKEKFQSIPKIAPFLAIIVGVMYVLYGGVATPSEAAGVGAALCVRDARSSSTGCGGRGDWWTILRDTTRESVMILMIIAAAVLFGYMLTSLYLTQTLAQAIADMHVNRWVLMGADQRVPAGVRLLHPAGGDHPDDQPHPATRSSRRRASTRCGSA